MSGAPDLDPERRGARHRVSRRTSGALAAACAACLGALLLLPDLGATPLVDWDEAIYAAVARGALEGDPWQLRWNGEPYDRKPPLLFWSMATSFRVLGVGEGAARLPSALAGIATLAVVALAAARRGGFAVGLACAALVAGSSLFLERGGRRACTDALLVLFTVSSLERATHPGGGRPIQAGIAAGLAILAKGVIGLLDPCALLAAGWNDRERRRAGLRVALAGFAVALPWYVAQLALRGEPFAARHFGYEVFERIVRPIHGDGAPWWYPAWRLFEGGGTWVFACSAIAAWTAYAHRRLRPEIAPWLVAAALLAVGASAMQTKLPWYPLPAIPLVAAAVGIALGAARDARPRAGARLARAALLASAGAVLWAAPAARRAVLEEEALFEGFRSFGPVLAEALRDEPFIGATHENPTLIFYGGTAIRLYDPDELDRLLLDPEVFPRFGLVHEDRAATLIDAGASEVGRLGDRILVHYAPAASSL